MTFPLLMYYTVVASAISRYVDVLSQAEEERQGDFGVIEGRNWMKMVGLWADSLHISPHKPTGCQKVF